MNEITKHAIASFYHEEEPQLANPSPCTFTAGDGRKLTGGILKPPGCRPEDGQTYPAVLAIHGGPRPLSGTPFLYEMQVWANAGYFVFFMELKEEGDSSPKGNGRPEEGGRPEGDDRPKGGSSPKGSVDTVDRACHDLMEFTSHILDKEPQIDSSRLGIIGDSYGGFMVNWTVCHTDRFRAAVSRNSISDWITFEYLSDIGDTFTKDHLGVSALEDPETLWNLSPLRYVSACKTPTLFIHSEKDTRCHLTESLEMFSALKILDIPARMCVLRGEGHSLPQSRKSKACMIAMAETLNWLDRHLKAETNKKEQIIWNI